MLFVSALPMPVGLKSIFFYLKESNEMPEMHLHLESLFSQCVLFCYIFQLLL